MMFTKAGLFGLGLLVLLLLTSCGPSNQSPYTVDYFKGVKGIELEFVGESPPDIVYENTEFPLAVFVSNEGAFSMEGDYKGVLSYSFDSYYFKLKENSYKQIEHEIIDMPGKSYMYPKGDIGVKLLPTFITKEVTGQRESPSTDIFVSVCYPYNTILTDEVCIDTSVAVDARERVCRPEDKNYNSQGGPVVVTSIEMGSQTFGELTRPIFIIEIENKGSGMVLAPVAELDISDACEIQKDSSAKKDWNKIQITVQLSGDEITCIPEFITLKEEKGFARCYPDTQTFGGYLNYLTSLVVELDYVYLTSISKSIEIVRSGIPDLQPLSNGDCAYWEHSIGGECVSNCDLCSQGAKFAFCGLVDYEWSCDCGPVDCLLLAENKKIEEQTGIELNIVNGNCIFGSFSLCEPGKFCCVKQ